MEYKGYSFDVGANKLFKPFNGYNYEGVVYSFKEIKSGRIVNQLLQKPTGRTQAEVEEKMVNYIKAFIDSKQ